MEDFLTAWRQGAVPLRRRHGFQVLGAWTTEGQDRFVWIVGYEGGDSFQAADQAYYASPERKQLDPDPAGYIQHAEHHLLEPVAV